MTVIPIREERPYETPPYQKQTVPNSNDSKAAIVIDHGAWQCRAGWSQESEPALQFDNLIAKVRDWKQRPGQSVILGDELDSHERSGIRSAMDVGTSVVVHPEMMEHLLDHCFNRLLYTGKTVSGVHVNELDRIPYPVVMTEALGQPVASRSIVSELLFECYRVPAVSYGLDSLFSYYYNNNGSLSKPGLMVSCGHTSSQVVPIFGNKWMAELTKRVPVGGWHAVDFMSKLLQMKYPQFPVKITPNNAQNLLYNYSHVAEDFLTELRGYEDFDELENRTTVFQYEYAHLINTKSSEELEAIAKRKEANRLRMIEVSKQQRMEKMHMKQEQLADYQDLKDLKETDPETFYEQMRASGFKNERDLEETIKTLQYGIKRIQNKLDGLEEPEMEVDKEIPTFPLVDIPDTELTDEQKKEKRKQRLLKAGYDAREKMRIEKEEQRAKKLAEEKAQEERRLADPAGWLDEIHGKRANVIKRIKERRKQERMRSDRRGAMSNSRMKTIASLAADETLTKSGSKRRRQKEEEDDDGFGANDDDWAVYREIKNAEESEDDEEEDQRELEHYENLLIHYDPDFDAEENWDLEERKASLFYRMRFGPLGYIRSDDTEGHYQLRLNVERIRVPEILFQPHLLGYEQAGLTECLQTILGQFPMTDRQALCQNVWVSGTHSLYPGLIDRLQRDLTQYLPTGTPIHIQRASNPRLNAWHGASQWTRDICTDPKRMQQAFISRKEYEEMGSDYLKEHEMSNIFYRLK